MNKIRMIVAHDNKKIKEEIVESIKSLDYVEVVGTATDGIDAYHKIIDLRPEVVFTEYNFNDMKGLDLMRKSKEKLKDKIPSFNIIVDMIPENELREALDITDNKINALVRKPYYDRAMEIVQGYREDIM